MLHSLRWRIAVPYSVLALVTMIALTLYLSAFIRQAYLDNLSNQLTDDALLITETAAPLFARDDASAQLTNLARRYAALLQARVTIIGADGTVLGESSLAAGVLDSHLTRPEVQQALTSGQGASVRYSDTQKQQLTYAAVRVQVDGQTVGVVRLALSLIEVNAKVDELDRTLVGATLVALVVIIVLATLIAERTAHPVHMLLHGVDEMARGNWGVRISPTTRDESGQLATAFNAMATRFQNQMEAITDQRNKLVAVLTHMTDGAVITDREGRVQLFNPAAAHLLGLGDSDVTGQGMVAVARDHEIVEVWQRCRQTGREQSAVVEVSGRGPFLRIVATPLQEPSAGGALLILQDLTQVRRLETVRRDFISNISHELRNPLAALKALVETLRDGALYDGPMAERFLTQMDAEVDSMTQMVRELLELSRIESGKVPLHLAPTTVADLVNPAVERLQPQAERAGLTMSVDLPDGLPLVMADRERLQQVLTNLLHNAIKFTPPGGRIVVSAEPGEKITIVVRDSGVGIAAADLSRIFERFYKVDRARSSGGTGLGLAIAKHIVQAHGGQIWAESVEGHGAVFRFTLLVSPA